THRGILGGIDWLGSSSFVTPVLKHGHNFVVLAGGRGFLFRVSGRLHDAFCDDYDDEALRQGDVFGRLLSRPPTRGGLEVPLGFRQTLRGIEESFLGPLKFSYGLVPFCLRQSLCRICCKEQSNREKNSLHFGNPPWTDCIAPTGAYVLRGDGA